MTDKSVNKIDSKKLDMAAGYLKDIVKLIGEYEKFWKSLTPQEKAVAGGIVFNINSIWGNFNFIGAIAPNFFANFLISQLANFFNQQMSQRNGGMSKPSIMPATSKTVD